MDLEEEFLTELKKRKQRQFSKRYSLRGLWSATSAKVTRFRKISAWVALGLLLVVLVNQVNTYPGANPTDSLLTRLVYNPMPPDVASPWPWKNQNSIHPAVAAMPPDVETSIKSVAAYIAQQEKDASQQVKAVHDYVVTRVTYDLDVLETGVRPSQDARTVFKTHKAVCEGYANLFAALAQAMNLEVAYVQGRIRRDLAPLDLIPAALRLTRSHYDWTLHAWNAVKVSNSWQLVDTTWDDSADSTGKSFYSADYLMLPPEMMIVSHLPEEPIWQLLPQAVDRKTFEAKPLLRPQFFAQGLSLAEPTTYTTELSTVGQSHTPHIQINSGPSYPHQVVADFTKAQAEAGWINTVLEAAGSQRLSHNAPEEKQMCQTSRTQETFQLFCPFSETGLYEVLLYSLTEKSETLLGQLRFQVT